MARIQRVSTIAAILLIAVLLPSIASARKARYDSWYVYSIPFTCGESVQGDTAAVPGTYATAITLTNMSRSGTIVGTHVEVTVPNHSKSDRVRRPIAANSAATIDCDTIVDAFVIATPLDAHLAHGDYLGRCDDDD